MYYYYYYIQTNIICIIILAIIGFGFFKKDVEKTSSLIFKQLCIVTILFCIFDLLAGLWRGATFIWARTLLEIVNSLYLWLGLIIAFLWLKYVLIKLDKDNTYARKLFVYRISLFVMSMLIIMNHWTHFLFSIDSSNLYARNSGMIFYFLVTLLYLLIPTYKIIYRIISDKNLIINKNLIVMILFIIPPIFTNILQFLFYGTTLNQVGITIAILTVFLNSQKNQIILYELTRLNNRRELNRYLGDIIVHKNGSYVINLLMIDVNHFKEINDNYGHIMGDKALIEIANSLRTACKRISRDLFISRYGGDEFVIVGDNLEKNEIKRLESIIKEELNIINTENKNPYTLEVSIGYVDAPIEEIKSIETFIAEADKKMYIQKQKMHATKK